MEYITTYKAKWQIPNNNMHPISIDWDLKLCYVKLCENKEWPYEVSNQWNNNWTGTKEGVCKVPHFVCKYQHDSKAIE